MSIPKSVPPSMAAHNALMQAGNSIAQAEATAQHFAVRQGARARVMQRRVRRRPVYYKYVPPEGPTLRDPWEGRSKW